MTFTPDELRIMLHWWGVYENEMHTSDSDEYLEGKIRDHLDKIDDAGEENKIDTLISRIKVSPMAKQLLVQAYFRLLSSDELTLHLRPVHKHLLTFQPE